MSILQVEQLWTVEANILNLSDVSNGVNREVEISHELYCSHVKHWRRPSTRLLSLLFPADIKLKVDREQPFVWRSLIALLGLTCLQWMSDEHLPSNDNTAHCQASLRFDGLEQISSMDSKSPEGKQTVQHWGEDEDNFSGVTYVV